MKKHNNRRRRIFNFGVHGYFELGALLDGLRRLMSYKLALHVLVMSKFFQFIFFEYLSAGRNQ